MIISFYISYFNSFNLMGNNYLNLNKDLIKLKIKFRNFKILNIK